MLRGSWGGDKGESMLMNYFSKLKGILFEPKKTLRGLKKEKGISKPFSFFLISNIISSLIFSTYVIIGSASIPTIGVPSGFLMGILFVFLMSIRILIIILFIFTTSGIFHLFIKLFGGNNPYYQTFKAFAYVSVIGIVSSLMPGINLLAPFLYYPFIIALFIWGLCLLGYSLYQYTGLSTDKLVWVFLISIFLEMIVIVVMVLLSWFFNPVIVG